jgi:hypothetical protein
MLHSLRDIKKTNSHKYEGVGEILLRQNFSFMLLVMLPFGAHFFDGQGLSRLSKASEKL